MRDFVRREAAAALREREVLWAKDLEKRVEQGWCIAELKFQGIDQDGMAVFSCQGNESRLREGDPVTLS